MSVNDESLITRVRNEYITLCCVGWICRISKARKETNNVSRHRTDYCSDVKISIIISRPSPAIRRIHSIVRFLIFIKKHYRYFFNFFFYKREIAVAKWSRVICTVTVRDEYKFSPRGSQRDFFSRVSGGTFRAHWRREPIINYRTARPEQYLTGGKKRGCPLASKRWT